MEFILNSREVFSCYEIHIINIYSGSKPIYCTCAYKLPKTCAVLIKSTRS